VVYMALKELIEKLVLGQAITIQLEEDEIEEGPSWMPMPGPVMPDTGTEMNVYPTMEPYNIASSLRDLKVGSTEVFAYTPNMDKRHKQSELAKRKQKLMRQKNKSKLSQKNKVWRKSNKVQLKQRAKKRHQPLGPIQPPKKYKPKPKT
jgi:hypothetical protein